MVGVSPQNVPCAAARRLHRRIAAPPADPQASRVAALQAVEATPCARIRPLPDPSSPTSLGQEAGSAWVPIPVFVGPTRLWQEGARGLAFGKVPQVAEISRNRASASTAGHRRARRMAHADARRTEEQAPSHRPEVLPADHGASLRDRGDAGEEPADSRRLAAAHFAVRVASGTRLPRERGQLYRRRQKPTCPAPALLTTIPAALAAASTTKAWL